MKKFLIQPCVLMIAAAGMLLSSCTEPKKTIEVLPGEPTVAIEFVGSPGVSSVSVKFVPTENASKYDFAFGQDQDRVSFENHEMVGMMQEMSNHERVQDWDDLEPDTYYVIYARAYNEAGEAGPVSALGFTTASSDFTVSTYYVSDYSAGFLVKTSNDYYQYSYAIGSPADRENFLNGQLDEIDTKNEVFEWVANYLSLTPDTDYVFYCQGIDRSGRDTQLFEIPFRTAAENSDQIPNFTWKMGRQDFYVQEYIVTPNELCKQLVLFQESPKDFDGIMFGENNYKGRILDMLNAYKDIATHKNVTTFTATNEVLVAKPENASMELDSPVEIYIAAYDDMYNPYMVKKYTSKTPSFNDNAAVPVADDIKLTVTDVDAGKESLTCTMVVNEKVRAYIFDLVEVAYFNEQFDGDYAKLRKYFIDNYNTVDETTQQKKIQGWVYGAEANQPVSAPYNFSALTKRGDYFLAAVGINENGPVAISNDGKTGWASEISVSETFTIPEKK